ncbi:MAG: 30S ribosomal protein S20 [Candidatus Paceibacterota bacterium]
MPILDNAKKALRASKRKAAYNQVVKSRAKTAVVLMSRNPSMELLSEAYKAIDKAVKRHIYQANKGARMKAQLAKLVKPTKLVAKPKVAKKVTKKAAPAKATKKTVKKPAKKAASPKKKPAKK